jgi:N-acetylglucosaminyl-diphospho-decaprenol L-rhamnosyltransferase
MRPRPDLSIVLVTYNSLTHVERCLQSLEAAVRDWGGRAEILVVDNASTDGTPEALARRAGIELLRRRVNVGFAGGVNTALPLCRAPFVLLHNPDCTFVRGLGEMIDFLRARPQAAAAGPRILQENGAIELGAGRFPTLWTELCENFGLRSLFPRSPRLASYLYGDWDRQEDRRVEWLTGACLLLRMEALELVGPLDEDFFLYTEELDLQWRLAEAGYESWFLAHPEVVHLGGRSAAAHRRALLLNGQVKTEAVKTMTLFFRKRRGPLVARCHRAMLVPAYLLRLGLALLRRQRERWRPLLAVLGGLLWGFGAETAAAVRLRLKV